MTRVKEREWFARHPQYKDIQHVCGIDRLMDTMISLLAEKMRTQLPILVTQMKEQKRQVIKVYIGLISWVTDKGPAVNYCRDEGGSLGNT